MKRQLYRQRKAVSPVIATVLMIMVTMVGMTILFAFVASYSDNYKAGIGSSVIESLIIEDIWLSPSLTPLSNHNSIVNITIYNAGKIDSTITSAFANGLKLTIDGDMNLNEDVDVGQHRTLSLEWNNNWRSGNEYTFKISTLRGSNFEVTYRAP